MELFTTYSLQHSPLGEGMARVLRAALQAVDPVVAVKRHLQRFNDQLIIGDHSYNLNQYQRLMVTGAGKAGAPMALAISELLNDRLGRGILIVKEGYIADVTSKKIEILEAGHPIPDQRGIRGTKRIIRLLQSSNSSDLVICLISGGGSALLTSPCKGISLRDLQKLTALLLASGATINEINVLRKHLEQLKGGGLARLAAPAEILSLILSDVMDDHLDIIASGPTVPDPSTYDDAFKILSRYDIQPQTPSAVLRHLQNGLQGKLPETPKPGDAIFSRVRNYIVGNNLQAVQAAIAQAQAEGYNTYPLTNFLKGEAHLVGEELAKLAQQVVRTGLPIQKPACLVAGGETTVTLRGKGVGGRNLEVALGGVETLAGLPNVILATLATDGGDGPTDAAGATVTGETLKRAFQAQMAPADFLTHNDSYHFFQKLGDLICTGPTRTNVGDLAILFIR